MEDIESFSIGYANSWDKKVLDYKVRLFVFKKYDKNKFIKSKWSAIWPDDIQFDAKLKQEIENLY